MPLFGPPNIEKLKAKRNISELINALHYRETNVCQAAAEALDDLGWQPSMSTEGATYWIVKRQWEKCVRIGAPAIAPLTTALKDSDAEVRQAAAEALKKINDNQAEAARCIAALKDGDWVTRRDAAQALGEVGDARAVDPLIAALKDGDWGILEAAAKALGRIGDPRAVKPLIAALKDENVCQAASAALGEIGDAQAVGPLITALKDGGWVTRRAAAEALDKLGWQPDRSETGATYWIAKSRWDNCVEIGVPAMEPLIAALQGKDKYLRAAAAEALGQIGDACAVEPLLIAALRDINKHVREAAAGALRQLGDARAVDLLSAALKDREELVRRAAAEALEKLGWQPDQSESRGAHRRPQG